MTLNGTTPVETAKREYLGPAAQDALPSGPTGYLHGDLVDSTDMLTDATGSATATTAYSAFGEKIGRGLQTVDASR